MEFLGYCQPSLFIIHISKVKILPSSIWLLQAGLLLLYGFNGCIPVLSKTTGLGPGTGGVDGLLEGFGGTVGFGRGLGGVNGFLKVEACSSVPVCELSAFFGVVAPKLLFGDKHRGLFSFCVGPW